MVCHRQILRFSNDKASYCFSNEFLVKKEPRDIQLKTILDIYGGHIVFRPFISLRFSSAKNYRSTLGI